MPLFDDLVAGQGEFSFGFASPQYALVHVVDLGDSVRIVNADDGDRFVRFGWFTFGHTGVELDATERTYWMMPIWVDFMDFKWSPIPQKTGADNVAVYAEKVRWSLAPNCSMRLFISE